MKVMKLNVSYDGYYGGSVDETVILPLDINGILFEKLEEGSHDSEVYLGEIEGKHSEVYGDLNVEFIDLDKLNIKEISELIKESDISEFESFFEGMEEDFNSDLECENEDFDYIEYIKPLVNRYKVDYNNYSILSSLIHDSFIDELKGKYVQQFNNITILNNDFDKVKKLLLENGVKFFQ